MPTTDTAPRRRWLRWLAGTALAACALAAVVALAAYAGVRYLASEEVKRFEDVVGLNGGDVSFRSLRVSGWDRYPLVEVTVTDLRVGDREASRPLLLTADSIAVPLQVDFWNRRCASVLDVRLRGGGLHVRRGSTGETNLGRLFGLPGDGTAAEGASADDASAASYLRLDPAAELLVEEFDVSYRADAKPTHVAGRLRCLRVRDFTPAPRFSATAELDVHMHGMTLNEAGAYLADRDVAGAIQLAVTERVLTAGASGLLLGRNAVDLDARVHLDRDTTSIIRLAVPDSRVGAAREVLAPGIREAIAPFDVEGSFASVTEVASGFSPGDRAVVTVGLHLRGQTARVNGETFDDTYLDARFVNVPADSSGGRRGSQFFIDTAHTRYFGFDMRTAGAVVEADRGAPVRLIARGELRGPASSVSRAVRGRDFVFTRGRVLAKAEVDGPVEDVMRLMAGATIDATFTDAAVRVPAAEVTLPFRRIDLQKGRDTTAFQLAGTLPGTRRDYRMEGHLRGIGWLFGTNPQARVETYVDFSAPVLAWREVVDLLGGGDGGDGSAMAPVLPDGPSEAPPPRRKPRSLEAKKSAFKSTLRLVQRTFRPSLDIAVDTVRYYGLEVTDFATGVHFEPGPTVVLERTYFNVDTGAVALNARLGIGGARRTPFSLAFEGEHLDLGRVAAGMDYFGMALLRELPALPNDVELVLEQRGLLDAVDGIVTEQAAGAIDLVSNGALPFAAQVDFVPDRPGLRDAQTTHVALQGSPELFNTFFQTEDFFFRGGTFDFRLGYGGLVPSLRALIDENRMQLRVEGAAVDYRSAGVRVPLEHLDVEMSRDTAAVDLRIEDARFGQELTISGHANNLSEIVLGESGKAFSSDVTLASPRLVWRDVNRLLEKLGDEPASASPAEEPPPDFRGEAFAKTSSARSAPPETAPGSPPRVVLASSEEAPADTQLHFRRTIKEVFTRFRPRATVRIGELQLTDALAVSDLNATVSLGADDVLYVDTTGFDYGDGYLDLAARLDLSDLALTPFRAVLNSDRLEVASLLAGLDFLEVSDLANAERLGGVASLRLDVAGAVTGGDDVAAVLTEATCGSLDLQVRDLELAGVPAIDEFAAGIKMRKRLEVLRFAPIDLHFRLDGNEVYLAPTELQSNAMNAFVEGVVRVDSTSSVLVSLPVWPNLRRDLAVVPEREGVDRRGFRVHFELFGGARQGGVRTRFRLRRKPWVRRAIGASEEDL